MLRFAFLLAMILAPLRGWATTSPAFPPQSPLAVTESLRPVARSESLPAVRWSDRARGLLWTRASVSALRGHASDLPRMVPRDIDAWCPAYRTADKAKREAFWVGLLSALAKHESTYRPKAVGGGGRWYGLLQILPGTARSYGCRAYSGDALIYGPANLSCALRIMAHTVARDGVVSKGMRGVAADWGPFHNAAKRDDMMSWTRSQSFCRALDATRPKARPIP
ncbi:transglycosylase SLT domain-containing protein [Puniceibacterium sediminis]|uniref:Transglycosylase SLT domain-containing protein n=1 Tax=Puniceibacterium sediminis TaxID=1608407 RepID=A0A238UWV7_9RHOB|nr:transglycosylase SLT domain-containing protein [Puniceibacterium sediminis]SNR26740.1 Transglycosylase SLT domain-containing protein [Puniceibacterium sediminis]